MVSATYDDLATEYERAVSYREKQELPRRFDRGRPSPATQARFARHGGSGTNGPHRRRLRRGGL